MISVMLIRQHLFNINSYRYVVHVKPSSCDRCCLEAFLAPCLGKILTLISGTRGESNPKRVFHTNSPSRCVPTGPRIPYENWRGGLGGGVGGGRYTSCAPVRINRVWRQIRQARKFWHLRWPTPFQSSMPLSRAHFLFEAGVPKFQKQALLSAKHKNHK